MAFDSYSSNQNTGSNKESTVDWEALNTYVVETAGLQQRETLVGYIAGIVDLGTQEQEDAEHVFNGDAEKEAEEIKAFPNTYFKDGKDEKGNNVRLKCFPQKPVQCVSIAVDFPDIMLNKGKFFGDENAEEKPLRLWLGGQFYMKDKGMVVGRPIPLRESNIAEKGSKAVWSFAPNHSLYKMALGAKIVQQGEPFKPRDIDKLLGQSLQFEAQVFFKESKGKKYYTEYVKYVSGLGRKQDPLELVTTPFLIQFNCKNNEEALKEVRSHVINTMRLANNFAGSQVEKQLNEIQAARQGQEEEKEVTTQVPKKTPAKQEAKKEELDNELDDFSEAPF